MAKITKKMVDNLDFDGIAKVLLNGSELVVGDTRFRICEIEFYVKNSKHNDEYTHCIKDQLEYEKFYFHRYKTGTYKSGTYKGMDIALGDKAEKSYFGVLIRAIYNTEEDEFIEGPCKSVNKILELNGVSEVKDMVCKLDTNIFTFEKVKLEYNGDLEWEDIYTGTRIGLSDKYPDYKAKKYRYITFKNKIKKEKKSLELAISQK